MRRARELILGIGLLNPFVQMIQTGRLGQRQGVGARIERSRSTSLTRLGANDALDGACLFWLTGDWWRRKGTPSALVLLERILNDLRRRGFSFDKSAHGELLLDQNPLIWRTKRGEDAAIYGRRFPVDQGRVLRILCSETLNNKVSLGVHRSVDEVDMNIQCPSVPNRHQRQRCFGLPPGFGQMIVEKNVDFGHESE